MSIATDKEPTVDEVLIWLRRKAQELDSTSNARTADSVDTLIRRLATPLDQMPQADAAHARETREAAQVLMALEHKIQEMDQLRRLLESEVFSGDPSNGVLHQHIQQARAYLH